MTSLGRRLEEIQRQSKSVDLKDDASDLPIGIRPRHDHDSDRLEEINNAIERYMNHDTPIPIPEEWLSERNEIINRLKLYYINRAYKKDRP